MANPQQVETYANDSADDIKIFCEAFAFLKTTSRSQCNHCPKHDRRRKRVREHNGKSANENKNKRSRSSRNVSQSMPSSSSKRQPTTLKDLNKIFHELNQSQGNNNMINTSITVLPTEVLREIFLHLDDLSLIEASRVCTRWNQILHSEQKLWRTIMTKRWPLFQRKAEDTNWYLMFSSLLSSCFCRICAMQMMHNAQNDRERLQNHRRAENDGRSPLYKIDGIEAIPLSKNLAHWQASIVGPANSPYEGGIFYLYVSLPFDYPFHPPVFKFLTKIIHPNISRHGDIGLDILKRNYSSLLTINQLLLCIQSLFCDPYTKVCMEPELGRLYDNDRPRFDALARHWTKKYAMMATKRFKSINRH